MITKPRDERMNDEEPKRFRPSRIAVGDINLSELLLIASHFWRLCSATIFFYSGRPAVSLKEVGEANMTMLHSRKFFD